ncbi:DUF202 domain-containing protein [Streptomyces alkaliterrae]|uniref:DUF202 domain-containing protein n=1 Tax=Streptomyces alkaliterrae TaxID=2213162 RepID=A0A5P0YT66_9ACTN|nr:DUF202 domain-containing protein [Streptomyces alkaliterrae]MBB1254230.1 DUF202 domain-containing protein [Streptomyces alkaliterrae]MBB1258061.1 DUF202 domain-containing protein [Streptomyces alkaliterrae]MQS02622.1 DUF202 domain-containing protein [Streptomyces alkaliterrae]
MSSDGRPRDPAAQPERTRFAWRRTTLAGGIVVVLALRHALVRDGGWAGLLLVTAAVVCLLLLTIVAHVRMRQLDTAVPVASGNWPVLTGTAAVLSLAGIGAALLAVAER